MNLGVEAPPAAQPGALARLRAFAWRHRLEAAIFAAAFVVYALASGPRFFHQSAAPHFIYQAEAWLHGQLHLAADPPDLEDWARMGDRFYVSFPPFPALVMLPFVALNGYQFNDVSFTVFFGALNVLLLFLVLRRYARWGDAPRSERELLWITAFFAVGTLHFYMAIRGEVWFTAEVMGVTFALLYLLAAHRARHPVLAGLALSAAALTRTPLAFAVIFFLMEVLAPDGRFDRDALRSRRRDTLRRLALFAAPLTVFAAAMMWMNQVRFGSPLEFGHSHLWNNRVNAQIAQYGLFDLHYLERNLHSAFTRLPTLSLHPLQVGFDGHGMSLLLTTPLFLLLLWPKTRPRLHRALWLTVLVVALPALFYQNDGYYQFGFRFSLDWTPFLFLLLAMGGRPVDRWFKVLGAIGVGMATWGALAFKGGWLS